VFTVNRVPIILNLPYFRLDPTDTGSYSTFPTTIIIFPRCILAYESRVMFIKLTVQYYSEYRFDLFCGRS